MFPAYPYDHPAASLTAGFYMMVPAENLKESNSRYSKMNHDLADILDMASIDYKQLTKSEKVRILSRWSSEFAALVSSARKDDQVAEVSTDYTADEFLRAQKTVSFYLLPDDNSGMPSVRCRASYVPNLNKLLSDTYTTCDEIVIIDSEFSWSCVVVNHGVSGVGRYFYSQL